MWFSNVLLNARPSMKSTSSKREHKLLWIMLAYVFFCMIDFLSWILDSVYRQWLLEVSPSQSNGFHVRIMPVFNAVLPEGLKTMSVQYWGFLALSFAHSDSPDFFWYCVTAEDEIFRVLAISWWGRLFWNGCAICRCSFFVVFFPD